MYSFVCVRVCYICRRTGVTSCYDLTTGVVSFKRLLATDWRLNVDQHFHSRSLQF